MNRIHVPFMCTQAIRTLSPNGWRIHYRRVIFSAKEKNTRLQILFNNSNIKQKSEKCQKYSGFKTSRMGIEIPLSKTESASVGGVGS